MYSKNHPPTSAQKRFWTELADGGCLECGAPAEIHHILGAAAKQNKVHIGQWAVVPLCPGHHRIWEQEPKDLQLRRFVHQVLEPRWRRFGELPINMDELMAICTWSR